MRDMIFSAAFKVYSTVSSRRFISDLTDAYAKDYISKVPHFNSIFNYLELPDLTPILHELITSSSLPLGRRLKPTSRLTRRAFQLASTSGGSTPSTGRKSIITI